jgi:signal peptidase II
MSRFGRFGRFGRMLVLLALVATTIGCDRVTKHAAMTYLDGKPSLSFFADTVRLEYAENTGGFMSFGANLPPAVRMAVFTIGTALILAATIIAAIRLPLTSPSLIGLSLAFAGGLSNLADRIIRGSVTDFLNIGFGSLRTGIFNVADIAIALGVCVLLWTYRQPNEDPEPEGRP